jgi:hypothetical protein
LNDFTTNGEPRKNRTYIGLFRVRRRCWLNWLDSNGRRWCWFHSWWIHRNSNATNTLALGFGLFKTVTPSSNTKLASLVPFAKVSQDDVVFLEAPRVAGADLTGAKPIIVALDNDRIARLEP